MSSIPHHYQLTHRTRYDYTFPVSQSYHSVCLRPPNTQRYQEIEDYRISITPNPLDYTERKDFFGNRVGFFSIQEFHEVFEVVNEFKATVYDSTPPADELTTTCLQVKKSLHGIRNRSILDALQYIYPSSLVPESEEIESFAQPFFEDSKSFLQSVLELNEYIYKEFEFDPKATDIATPVSDVLKLKRGVCQDFAHLMIAAIRNMNLPARYVSGYLLTLTPEGQSRLAGSDASHAWVAVFIPGYGWIDVDPTNNLVVSNQHIRVAAGRDFNDVSMVKGAITGGGPSQLLVEVSVDPIKPVNNQQQSQ